MDKIAPGRCWISGKPTHEILSVFDSNHPLAGYPNRIGNILEDTYRVTLLAIDGKKFEITVKQEHLVDIDLSDIWHCLIAAEKQAFKVRQYMPKYDPVKALEAHENQLKLLCPPIAILDVKSPNDIRVTL